MSTPTRIELGDREYRIERPNGLKASRALALLRGLSRAMPDLNSDLARFRREYEAANVIELDRAQARIRHPARPLVDEHGEVRLFGEEQAPRFIPSPVDALTEEDWTRSGHLFRVPQTPTTMELVVAGFDKALELAEDIVYQLLALFTVSNDELAQHRRAGTVDELLTDRAAELLEVAYADELMELAVICGETVDQHFGRKAADLGDRLGNALRLIGITWTPAKRTTPASTDGHSSSRPSSSTDSPDSTPDGPPTSSSDSRGTSSSSSDGSSSSTPNGTPSSVTTPA